MSIHDVMTNSSKHVHSICQFNCQFYFVFSATYLQPFQKMLLCQIYKLTVQYYGLYTKQFYLDGYTILKYDVANKMDHTLVSGNRLSSESSYFTPNTTQS